MYSILYLAVSFHSIPVSYFISSSISVNNGWGSREQLSASSPRINWTRSAGGVTATNFKFYHARDIRIWSMNNRNEEVHFIGEIEREIELISISSEIFPLKKSLCARIENWHSNFLLFTKLNTFFSNLSSISFGPIRYPVFFL